MVEVRKWMFNPLKPKLAHYTRMSIPDPDGPKLSRCKKHMIDDSWTLVEEPERKCRLCQLSVETEGLPKSEKTKKQFDLWREWEIDDQKGR